MSCMGLDNCLKYRVENTRAISQALLGFVIYISGFEGLRCEQSPDTSSRCDTPIYYKVEILGGRNG